MNMNTRPTLIEVTRLLGKAHAMLQTLVEAHSTQSAGKPPQPLYGQRVKREIWNGWDKLKAAGEFDAGQAKKIIRGDTGSIIYRIDSSYSAILAEWFREGYIERVREGSGPLPSIYKIPR